MNIQDFLQGMKIYPFLAFVSIDDIRTVGKTVFFAVLTVYGALKVSHCRRQTFKRSLAFPLTFRIRSLKRDSGVLTISFL